MKLSPNFTLDELTATSYPRLQNKPSDEVLFNLICLCWRVLQPLRDSLREPVVITSGYRSTALNTYVGGVSNSLHLRGLAADIHVNNEEHAKRIFAALRQNKHVDACLFEHSKNARWIHVQTSDNPRAYFNFNYTA